MNSTPPRFRQRLTAVIALMSLLGFVLSACAADDPVLEEQTPTTTDDAAEMDEMDDDGHMDEADAEHMDFSFGEPADAASADRVIEIDALDTLEFDPSEITISVGETVTFRVTDPGALPHDFTLGTAEMQDEHEAEMAEMSGDMMMHDEPNVFALSSGETMEMTWHFTEPGEILFGCHQPGHYGAGMKGTITIEG